METSTHADIGAARRYDSWFDSPWGSHAWLVETRAVLAALGPAKGGRVVDIGCGTGRLTALLEAGGAHVIGVDLDSAMLAVAADRVPGRLALADAARLPITDGWADAAVTVATLEFTSAVAAVLAEMVRITRPGGRVVAAVLNPRSVWGLLDRPARRDPYAKGCFVTRAELAHLGAQHGRVHLDGALFTAERLPLRDTLGPPVERIGLLAPRLGAVQVLTITTGDR